MKVLVRKIVSNHDNLSKDCYTGITQELPKIGHYFEMEREMLHTTQVIAVRQHSDNEYTFGTKNSLYHLTVLEDTPQV